ncbi:MAG: N-acetyltransferase [Lactobacillus sp.]|jgi:predicted N-acetyltransferase YhbS|nr:N-acetyltransferase [Lactobacillus sp.]MCI2032197.1 N-acetyltransferase [Lactobacillus sp.]
MRIEPITAQYLTESLHVIQAAFATAPHTDGHEADLVKALRQSPTYHADYDVVALNDAGQVIGHAMLSPATVGDKQWPLFVLAPLAVRPDSQGQGVGGALLTYLEIQAGEDARRGLSILGDPAYYSRFGYQPAKNFGITAPTAVPEENFLLKELFPGGLQGVSGQLQYAPEFGL